MQIISHFILYILMACLMAGCIGAIRNPKSGIGFEFLEGIHQLGVIFIPIAGVMASLPYLERFIPTAFCGIAAAMGHDPAIWGGIFLPPDMGGNLLEHDIASSPETWIIALFVSFILGCNITFSIPMSVSMVRDSDYGDLALGILSGITACPVGITVSCIVCMLTNPPVRAEVSVTSGTTVHLSLTLPMIFRNLLPVYLICFTLAIGVWKFPRAMVRGFRVFGKVFQNVLCVIFALSAVEYFTGLFSRLIPGWDFSPIIADQADYNRALEIAGYCALMLGGAYPMLYLIQKYCGRFVRSLAKLFHVSFRGALGILASSVTLVALFREYDRMDSADRIRSAGWAFCSGFIFADHLVYCFNFQPDLYVPLVIGKITGGIFCMLFISRAVRPENPVGTASAAG